MYYQCYGKKMVKTDCTKKNMRKEFIERVVAEDALSMLTDENIELIASTAVQTNAREMESDTNIPAIRGKLHETEISLSNITKAIESGEVPQTLVKRMLELEKEKKSLEKDLKREEKKITLLDKELVVHWLEQFKNGDIEDEEFVKSLIDLLVNSVTVWDEPDGTFRVQIAYNLTDMPTKTYRLHPNDRDGTLSDLSPVDQHWRTNPIIHGSLLIRTVSRKQRENYYRNHPKVRS